MKAVKRKHWHILRSTYKLLGKNDPLTLSGATAFFTTFAISPIIIILVNVLTLYFNKESIRPQLFSKIAAVFGRETAIDIEAIVNNFRSLESNIWVTIGGSVFFLFVATTLLSVVRSAIHKIWNIRRKSGRRLGYGVKERAVETVMVLLIGVLFLFALFLDTSVSIFRNYLHQIVPQVHIVFIRVLNIIFSIVVITLWFTMVFKLLPEARVQWKVAFTGGLFTAILFSLGKFIMGKFLIHGKVASIFGASASIALLLLFIFYSSFILYFGAAFTHEYAKSSNSPIHPGRLAEKSE
jgi:membrane protein